MAKDPAINWYFDNWSGGVKAFTRHQKGCYIDLLESQFYLGHLSLEQIKNILGSDFSQWSTIKEKFVQDEQDKFFNERLELEKNKRAKYSESRSKNRLGKDMINISKSYEQHMNNTPETETEIVLDSVVKDRGVGKGFAVTEEIVIPVKVLEAAEMNQFVLTKNKNTLFLTDQWTVFLKERINDPPEKRYYSISDLTSYFLNWVRNKHPSKNLNHDNSGRAKSNLDKWGEIHKRFTESAQSDSS